MVKHVAVILAGCWGATDKGTRRGGEWACCTPGALARLPHTDDGSLQHTPARCPHTHSTTRRHTHTLSLALFLSHTHTHPYTYIHKNTNILSNHTISLSHTHTYTLFPSLT